MIAKSVSEVMEIAEQIQRQHYGPISDQMVYKKIKEDNMRNKKKFRKDKRA